MSDSSINIGVVGGNKDELKELSASIGKSKIDYQYTLINNKTNFLETINSDEYHLIMGDSSHIDFNVFEALDIVIEQNLSIPVIGFYQATNLTIVDALKKGLNDFVCIENNEHLKLVIEREIRRSDPALLTTSESGKDFTGIYSRLQFLEYLKKILPTCVATKKIKALLYLQLDNFGWINESNGILAGDVFLKNTAKTIADILKSSDTVARYQGGSFILLVEAEDLNKLHAKADMIRAAIADSVSDIEGNALSSTCSIGVHVVKDKAESLQEIISYASEASEIAKSNGGDAVNLFQDEEELSTDTINKHTWNERIREAFDKDLFLLFYQPIISLQGDNKARYEVLLRMVDEESNIISPGTFLPFAERAGLMADIDRRVILHSLQKGAEEKEQGNEIELFIKLSGKSLDDKKMPSWISNTLKEIDFPSENIVFEITEFLALTHLTQTRHLVKILKSLNCKIALDHFGTRARSFKLLEQLDIDYLKIDGSLVQNLASNKSHQVIVKNIIKSVIKKNIPVIAESVQEAGSLPIIWQYGIHFVQGYFLQIPDNEMSYDFENQLL